MKGPIQFVDGYMYIYIYLVSGWRSSLKNIKLFRDSDDGLTVLNL